jgi:hypothetical protein
MASEDGTRPPNTEPSGAAPPSAKSGDAPPGAKPTDVPASSKPIDLLASPKPAEAGVGGDHAADDGPVSVEISLSDLETAPDAGGSDGDSEPKPSEGWSTGPSSLAELYQELTEEERAEGGRPWWLDEDSHDGPPAKRSPGPAAGAKPEFSPTPLDAGADTERASGPTSGASEGQTDSRRAATRDAGHGEPKPARKSRSGRGPKSRRGKRVPRAIPLPPPVDAKADAAHALARTSKQPPPLRKRDPELEVALPPGIDGASTLTSELGPPPSSRLRDALVDPTSLAPPPPPPKAVPAAAPAAASPAPRVPVGVGPLAYLGSVLLAAVCGLAVGYFAARAAGARPESTAAGAASNCPCLAGSGAARDPARPAGTDTPGASRDQTSDLTTPGRPGEPPLGPGTVPVLPGSQLDAGALPFTPAELADGGGLGAPEPGGTVGPLATPEPSAAPEASHAFDPAAASAALSAAAGGAAACRTDSTEGAKSVTVAVTFAPSGRVTTATIMGGQFAGTPVGGCIAQAFKSAHVPPFDGDPVTVKKTVQLP